MAPNLIFSHPVVENRFRRATAGKTEVGGWLLCNYWKPCLWPNPPFSRRELAISLNLENTTRMAYIEGFIIVPNKSDHPKNEWIAWHYKRAKEVAQATGRVHDCHIIHFHSHPVIGPDDDPGIDADYEPSKADIAFAAASCALGLDMAEFCIVTSHPLRLWPYVIRWGDAASPHVDTELECGRFWTWRMKGLRRLRR